MEKVAAYAEVIDIPKRRDREKCEIFIALCLSDDLIIFNEQSRFIYAQ